MSSTQSQVTSGLSEGGLERAYASVFPLLAAQEAEPWVAVEQFPEVYSVLVQADWYKHRQFIARQKDVPVEVALVLTRDSFPSVTATLAECTNHPEVAAVLTGHEDEYTAELALRNPCLRVQDVPVERAGHVHLDALRRHPERLRDLVESWGGTWEEVSALYPTWEGTLGSLVEASQLVRR